MISIKISLKFVSKGPINNNPALVQMMAWRRQGDKPLSDPMMGRLPTHICVTRPQCVKIGKVWSIRVICKLGDLAICLHGCTWATLGQGLSLIGNVVFPYSIHVIFELFEAFDLRATFMTDMIILIINIFWLHWIINRLVVMHPYALSHNKAVLNWNNFVWSTGLILIPGLIASRSNKQQPTDVVS